MKAPKASSEAVSRSMKSNKSSGTKPELILSKLLRKRLYKNNLPGNPDFIYPKKKLAVFVHGCFWHRCPECKLPMPKSNRIYWKNKLDKNIRRDSRVRIDLRKIGWSSLVVWEHEVKNNSRKVVSRIQHCKD